MNFAKLSTGTWWLQFSPVFTQLLMISNIHFLQADITKNGQAVKSYGTLKANPCGAETSIFQHN